MRDSKVSSYETVNFTRHVTKSCVQLFSERRCGHTMKTLSDTVLQSCSHSHGCPDAAVVALEGIWSVPRCFFCVCVSPLCICVFIYTPKQIAEDMEAMKRRHQLIVQELEENFQITARENQVRKCVYVSVCMNPLKYNGNYIVWSGMHHAEDQISLPEQVEQPADNPGPLSRESGEEECWLEEESCGQHCSSVSPSLPCGLFYFIPNQVSVLFSLLFIIYISGFLQPMELMSVHTLQTILLKHYIG